MNGKDNFNRFFAEEIIFENHWKPVTTEQINEVIDEFPGKKDFIKFYLAHNGGVFTEDAYFYTNDFYEASKEYLFISVASFLHVPLTDVDEDYEDEDDGPYTMSIEREKDRRMELSEEFADFILFHIPFADNYGDNSFWIDIQTGEIKYMNFDYSYNPDDAVIVASSFSDFCKRIESKRR